MLRSTSIKIRKGENHKEYPSWRESDRNMTDIALIGSRTFLFEKLFRELGASYQFLQAGILGSPFLPQYKMIMIPTGFANPQYSEILPVLRRMRSKIADFVKKGGVLTVLGHGYISRVRVAATEARVLLRTGAKNVVQSQHECCCLLCTSTPECDGYLLPGEGFEVVVRDEKTEQSL